MSNPTINNKKARFEFEILDKYIAGMVLQGSEIKSIRQGKASIKEAYCFIEDGELFIRNMHISVYEEASINNHDPIRVRKLLLGKQELNKIQKKLRDTGITVVPMKVFISKKGWAKLEIGIGKGKKLFDKRDSLKQKDVKRQIDRESRDH